MPRRLTSTDLARAEIARKNLIRFRHELGFSAAVLADRAQMPVDTYRQLERGTRRLTNAITLADLARATGHRMEDFFELDPPLHDSERLALVGLRILAGAKLDNDLWTELSDAVREAERKQRRRNRQK